MCYKQFIQMKIIQPLATFRCRSLFYENMYIFATPGNNKTECWDGSDEPDRGNTSTIVWIISGVLIMGIYIILKYSGLAKKMLSEDNENIVVDSDQSLHQNRLDYTILKNYSGNHDDPELVDETNIHFLNSIHTQTVDGNTDTFKNFYELEQEIHHNNESEIYLWLHKKIDPKVVKNILDSGEPGCTENCVRRRWIMELQNKITKTPILKEIINTAIGIIKLELKYSDLFKDIAMSIILLQAVESFKSVWEFNTNFSSVVVMMQIASILIPLFLSTLHLTFNRTNVIAEETFSKIRKRTTITLWWIFSIIIIIPIIPIFLDAYYQELKEDVRKLTQNRDIRAVTKMKKCRKIKNQIVTFHKIELG